MVSQVFRGEKELTLEQAASLVEYLGLSEIEGEYFLGLVERARAGTPVLRKLIERRLERLKRRASELGDRLPQDRQLTPEQQAQLKKIRADQQNRIDERKQRAGQRRNR